MNLLGSFHPSVASSVVLKTASVSPVPLFSLPKNSVGQKEVSSGVALSNLSHIKAAFIGRRVAVILE